MGHGVPLKPAEYRNVFKAYIRTKQNLKADGTYKTFREIGADIGKGHTTIYGWMGKLFPALLAKMGGNEQGNPQGSPAPLETPTLEDEHVSEAGKALHALVQHATALESPVSRWHLARGLEDALAKLRSAGTEEPEPEQF